MKRRSFRTQVAGDLAGAVAHGLSLSLAEARTLVERGAVYVRGRRRTAPGEPVPAGTPVMVVLEEAGRSSLAEAAPLPPLRILFEDASLVVVDKPAGLPAQPTPGGAPSLLDAVSAHLGAPAGLVHRLDRDTTGVTVFGKSPAVTSALAAQFRQGRVAKQYLAIAGPALPPSVDCTLRLARDPSRPGRWRAGRQGLEARTELLRLAGTEELTLVQARPHTGRTHQIRAHLAALGAPIAGDRVYGGASMLSGERVERVLLHAQVLALAHPRTGAVVAWTAPLPPDLERWFARLGQAPPAEAPPLPTGAGAGTSPPPGRRRR